MKKLLLAIGGLVLFGMAYVAGWYLHPCSAPGQETILGIPIHPPPSLGASSSNIRSLMVVQGDTLSEIAEKIYGEASLWKEIAERNGIEDGFIYVGQVLMIPAIANRKTKNDRIAE